MSNASKTRSLVLKSFTDKGSGKAYRQDSIRLIPNGDFINFAAAGLVRAAVKKSAPASA